MRLTVTEIRIQILNIAIQNEYQLSDHGKYSTPKSIMGSKEHINVIMGSIVHLPHLPSTERPRLGI